MMKTILTPFLLFFAFGRCSSRYLSGSLNA